MPSSIDLYLTHPLTQETHLLAVTGYASLSELYQQAAHTLGLPACLFTLVRKDDATKCPDDSEQNIATYGISGEEAFTVTLSPIIDWVKDEIIAPINFAATPEALRKELSEKLCLLITNFPSKLEQAGWSLEAAASVFVAAEADLTHLTTAPVRKGLNSWDYSRPSWLRSIFKATPLSLSILRKQTEVALSLIDEHTKRGISVDTRDAAKNSPSPLHLAAHYGNWSVFQALLKAGADIEATYQLLDHAILGRSLGTVLDAALVSQVPPEDLQVQDDFKIIQYLINYSPDFLKDAGIKKITQLCISNTHFLAREKFTELCCTLPKEKIEEFLALLTAKSREDENFYKEDGMARYSFLREFGEFYAKDKIAIQETQQTEHKKIISEEQEERSQLNAAFIKTKPETKAAIGEKSVTPAVDTDTSQKDQIAIQETQQTEHKKIISEKKEERSQLKRELLLLKALIDLLTKQEELLLARGDVRAKSLLTHWKKELLTSSTPSKEVPEKFRREYTTDFLKRFQENYTEQYQAYCKKNSAFTQIIHQFLYILSGKWLIDSCRKGELCFFKPSVKDYLTLKETVEKISEALSNPKMSAPSPST